MPHPQGKQIAVATPDDARAWSRKVQLEGKSRPAATGGTWLDSGSSTCAGTSARESGLSSFESPASDGSDTSSTQPIPSQAKTNRRSNGKRVQGRHGQIWKTKRLERSSAMRSVQRNIRWISERLDAKCCEFSRLQIEVNRLRGELRERTSDSQTVSRVGGRIHDVGACVVCTNSGRGGVYWREADEASCPEAGTGCAWNETVSARTT